MPHATIIPFELPLPQILPTIEGNVDYREFRDQLLRIDELLTQSRLESQLLVSDLRGWLGRRHRDLLDQHWSQTQSRSMSTSLLTPR